jgi:hypothetical protein
MKTKLLLFLLFAFPLILPAQDTIFVKTGQVIPAIIVEKNDTEIKYKKFGQAEPAAIYSVFVSDVKSIHYKDGIIADYTQAGQPAINNKPAAAIEDAGTMKAMKFSIGGAAEYFGRNTDDALLVFWRDRLVDPKATIGGNPLSFPVIFQFSMPLGYMQRNWFGGGVQIIATPPDAIYATEINLKNFYSNITMDYSRSLNHKNNLLATIETGIDLAFMSGYIKLNNTTYNISGNSGMGFHVALGTDWLISKRFTASLRGGYRTMKIEVMYEDSSTDPPKYYNFFVDPPSEELLAVKWNGPYVNFGLKWSFYAKMKSMVVE